MKILFLVRRYYPDIGGVEKHVFEISKIFANKGHKVTIITQSQGEASEIYGIRIVRIPPVAKGSSEKLHIWKWMFKNWRIIKDSNIVHIHDVYFWYFPSRIMFLSKKSFITFHGYESYPIKLRWIVIRKISELLADGNIIVGEFMKKWYYAKPNFIIYGATNISKYKKPEVRNSACFIGRLDYHTNIKEYAHAVDIIRKKIPDFRFEILGDGPDFKKILRFNPVGFKNNPEKYLEKSNFAFVSRYLAILESFAQKRLVFAFYDNPVKEDYLKMTPFEKFIITADSAEKLAEKVQFFLKNPKNAKRFEDLGYNWVKDQTWDNIAEIYLKLWKE